MKYKVTKIKIAKYYAERQRDTSLYVDKVIWNKVARDKKMRDKERRSYRLKIELNWNMTNCKEEPTLNGNSKNQVDGNRIYWNKETKV